MIAGATVAWVSAPAAALAASKVARLMVAVTATAAASCAHLKRRAGLVRAPPEQQLRRSSCSIRAAPATKEGGEGGPGVNAPKDGLLFHPAHLLAAAKAGGSAFAPPLSPLSHGPPVLVEGGRKRMCAPGRKRPNINPGSRRYGKVGDVKGGGGREQGQRVAQRQRRGYLAGRSRPARSAYRRLSVESRTSRARCWRYVSQFAPSLARAGVPPDRSWRRRALEMLVRATCRPSAQMRSSLTHCPARRRSHCAFRAVAAATDVLRASLTDNEPHNTVLAGQGRPNSTSPSPAGPGGWGWE